MSDVLSILADLVILVIFIFIMVKVAGSFSKGAASMTTTLTGAADAFYNKGKKKAMEIIVEQKAGKKMEEQASEE